MFYETLANKHGLPHDPFLACVGPRPIGWVSTVGLDGKVNLAPFSFYNAVAHRPPKIMFSGVGLHADGGVKDSVRNAEQVGEFVLNIATWDLREEMNYTSAHFDRGVNEAEMAELALEPSVLVKPPRVKASPIHLECRYMLTVRLPTVDPAADNSIVFGEVLGVHIDDRVLVNGKVDLTRVKPIGRLGYMEYCVVDKVFTLGRPTVGAKPAFNTNIEMFSGFADSGAAGPSDGK